MISEILRSDERIIAIPKEYKGKTIMIAELANAHFKENVYVLKDGKLHVRYEELEADPSEVSKQECYLMTNAQFGESGELTSCEFTKVDQSKLIKDLREAKELQLKEEIEQAKRLKKEEIMAEFDNMTPEFIEFLSKELLSNVK